MPVPLLAAMALGGGIGGLVSGGIYLWKHRDGGFSWGGLAANVAGGAVAGAMTPVAVTAMGTTLIGTMVGTGVSVAAGSALTRIWENLQDGAQWWQGTLQTAAIGFLAGAFLVGGVAGKFLNQLARGTADAAASGAAVALLASDGTPATVGDPVNTGQPGPTTNPGSELPTGDISDEQLNDAFGLCHARNMSLDDLLKFASQAAGRPITDVRQLSRSEATRVLDALRATPAGVNPVTSSGTTTTMGDTGGPTAVTNPHGAPDPNGTTLGSGSSTATVSNDNISDEPVAEGFLNLIGGRTR